MPPVDPQVLKAFDAVTDLVKQFMTLSTGVIALTITFLKDVVKSAPPGASRHLKRAWVLYCTNIVFGVWALMAIVGTITDDAAVKDVWRPGIAMPVGLQAFTFLCGTALVIAFGAASLKHAAVSGGPKPSEGPAAAGGGAAGPAEPPGGQGS